MSAFWTRKAQTLGPNFPTFYLKGEDHPIFAVPNAVSGPDLEAKIPRYLGKYVDEIICKIINRCQPLNESDAESFRQVHMFTNREGFMPEFRKTFKDVLRSAENNQIKDPTRFLHLSELAGQVNNKDLSKPIFQRVLSTPKKAVPDCVEEMMKIGKARNVQLNTWRKAGKSFRNRATWVGLERVPQEKVQEMDKKLMVETQELLEMGLQSGLFFNDDQKGPNYICLEGSMHRICAPKDQMAGSSIIFWTKNDADDTYPTSEKIFGGVVYNPECVAKELSPDAVYVDREIKISNRLVGDKTGLDRPRLATLGKMAKGTGPQTTFNAPYPIHVPADIGDIPTDLKHGGHDSDIRVPIKAEEAAKLAGLLSPLGHPFLSNFVTYGYSASTHLDDDITPTSGWVTYRSRELNRNTSNFVWASHAVIVEMSSNMYWYWKADEDGHGTTVNIQNIKNPEAKLTPTLIRNSAGDAQWTRVSVLSRAVANGHSRMEKVI
ncbi:hypothetical protein FA15DRAFT_660700 [Coprinopsis marcescibilis]|uniref:Uncharacterized protein n=1 Tax=Coprinopsis marcescibilis TaxID=230819 RepID=A0A5C3KF92_COPMA|nr:hypothetical protein FA15DRAFT_660700 [Coprinopsis marcescibilis]